MSVAVNVGSLHSGDDVEGRKLISGESSFDEKVVKFFNHPVSTIKFPQHAILNRAHSNATVNDKAQCVDMTNGAINRVGFITIA